MHEVFPITYIHDVVGRDFKIVSTHLYVVGWDYYSSTDVKLIKWYELHETTKI